jgi:hypothetical protein
LILNDLDPIGQGQQPGYGLRVAKASGARGIRHDRSQLGVCHGGPTEEEVSGGGAEQ